jgi:hypothetical protein
MARESTARISITVDGYRLAWQGSAGIPRVALPGGPARGRTSWREPRAGAVNAELNTPRPGSATIETVTTNVYFDLTRAFNAHGPVAALSSGQAVVFYRVAIMSKDGDWVIRETAEACRRVLDVLADQGAWYRPGAPLDPLWLSGGWSSHFEHRDGRGRRVRCDFFSRPPRVPAGAVERIFATATDPLLVVDRESLILMKQTQRAKDYAVIGELAAGLPSEREVEVTTDVERLLALAPHHGANSARPALRAAQSGDRDAVVVELAREADRLMRDDRARVNEYSAAARRFLEAFAKLPERARRLPDGHDVIRALAEAWLPAHLRGTESRNADVE